MEASRAERMRQNGHGTLTLEDARTWIEETGLCLFLPRRQYSSSIAPSFVEAVAGERNAAPDPKHIAVAEELLVRLETDGVAVRLNLLGQPGEQPDFVVAAWVLPYVYALRGDRDWRRSPQLTGSRQVSQLAVLTYKLLEAGDATIADLTRALGREVTEGAVLRAITELWQQLRIIPIVFAPGQAAEWQLLRQRFQKAIAEGASTSQVTAISVLASIYLQAVIAASMEEVELFLSPLTARSKIREVLRGLVATRQVHTISLGHAPHFYVAGTLPEFAPAPTIYSSSSMPASAYFMHSREEDEVVAEPVALQAAAEAPIAAAPVAAHQPAESHAPRPAAPHKPVAAGKPAAARPHFSRPATHSRDRKPSASATSSRPARRTGSDSRPASGVRWSANSTGVNGKRNGTHSSTSSSTGARPSGNGSRPSSSASGARTAKPAASAWGRSNSAKPAGKSSGPARSSSLPRKDSRTDARPAHSSHKPTLTAGTKAGNSKRFGFTARPKQDTKKRG
ncbi:MAG: hypothetical protein P4K97_05585 [Terracidiphilus sp.]|nr:hypothetical protein [Terracidiphilus sp.]